jgi:hypothetical protein
MSLSDPLDEARSPIPTWIAEPPANPAWFHSSRCRGTCLAGPAEDSASSRTRTIVLVPQHGDWGILGRGRSRSMVSGKCTDATP